MHSVSHGFKQIGIIWNSEEVVPTVTAASKFVVDMLTGHIGSLLLKESIFICVDFLLASNSNFLVWVHYRVYQVNEACK